MPEYGTLFIVATPLGNLEDMTFRAVDTLKKVDLIAAEDTRHSKKLLSHYGISTRLISCHEHNEAQKTHHLISQLKTGMNLALISDAGTPCISDPGYTLVSTAAKENIGVVPIPGCSAAIAGLSVSGLPTDAFLFIGFLPRKQQKQIQAVSVVQKERATLIIYESPNRIKKTIAQLISILGDRPACLAREITKLHEEFIRGPLSAILESLEQKEKIKGEIALFIQGCPPDDPMDIKQLEAVIIKHLSETDMPTSALARQLADQYAVKKKTVYNLILKLKTKK